MTSDRWVYEIEPGAGDAAELMSVARQALANGDRELAATAYDRAYALAPEDSAVASARVAVLGSLAVAEHGMTFHYVPAGCYLMGAADGEPDEQPAHYVRLDAFWLSDTPVTWSAYCALMDWEPPPYSTPRDPDPGDRRDWFFLGQSSKIRRQYCKPYEETPMVSVAWEEAAALGDRLSTDSVTYGLPTEAEWEAAARGGLARARYPWGNEQPDGRRCDFDRFSEFSIRPPQDLSPNGYGLYGMSGGVWEWTTDWYDALYYAESPRFNPTGPAQGKQHVLRGGSWADCAETVTVSFRMSRASTPWWEGQWGAHMAPNIGFRLCRRLGQRSANP